MRIVKATTPRDWEEAHRLVEEYAAGLGVDLCFQNFDEEIADLSAHYGTFLLAMDGDMPLGCVGLRQWDAVTGEIKRLYVAPAARGRALGRTLAEAIIDAGRAHGYQRLVLDTLPTMQAAQALYASLGFKAIESYRYNPIQGTVFMELDLRP